MRLSDMIEEFIKQMLKESKTIEIKRNELASRFECAPSQINYVLTTRFGSDKGYYVESKRGGGGGIRIIRIVPDSNEYVRKLILSSIGDAVTFSGAQKIVKSLREREIITSREEKIIMAATNERALVLLSERDRNVIRALMLKNILINII